MKNVLKAVLPKKEDNVLVAGGKGMILGTGSASVVLGAIGGTLILIGKCITKKEELEKFEMEAGAE
jgi:hypothetical protein